MTNQSGSMLNIYERQANNKMLESIIYPTGEYPARVWHLEIRYENGLVVDYDGSGWKVVREEFDTKPTVQVAVLNYMFQAAVMAGLQDTQQDIH